ncbi:hypothetical protein Tco_1335458 [Tanacetum coccineum]
MNTTGAALLEIVFGILTWRKRGKDRLDFTGKTSGNFSLDILGYLLITSSDIGPLFLLVLGQMASVVTCITLNSAASWSDSIRPEGFLSSVMLWLVIIVAVVGVDVTIVVVVVESWAKEFHQDRASSVKVPVAEVGWLGEDITLLTTQRGVKRPKGIAENMLEGVDKFTFPVDFIILDIPEDFKTPLILKRPFLSTTHAIINVFKAKITLSVRNDKIFFKSNKPTINIIKRVYALSLIKSTELDLEARLIGKALRKNRSHDPKFEDFLELNDMNKPLELRHDQVVDLGPIIEEGEVIDAPIKKMVKTRHDDDKITNRVKDYPSFSNLDRKIRVNDAYNLRFFCIIGYEHVDANFFPLLSINMMSKRFYNSIMKDKLEFKRKSVVGTFMNAPIFVGTFSVVTDFAVIEDMDRYRDEEMGVVIIEKEFCKETRVKAK